MMNETETEMTEQALTEPAVQPEPAAVTAAETPMPAAAEPAPAEEPRVDNNVPLPMVQMPPGGMPRQWTEHEYEMIHAGLMEPPPLREPEPQAGPLPEPPLQTEAAEPAPEANDEARRAAMEAYWKTALTGNPDSIPESFRARAASADITSSAEESEYDLLSAVNRSWYADHSEQSRETIQAEWPRIRTELSDRYGVADNERELFTALSLAPEEEERRKAAKAAYEKAYEEALFGREAPKVAPWEEEENPWAGLQRKAREEAAQLREELLPEAQTLSSLFRLYGATENGAPWEALEALQDVPDMAGLCRRMAGMDPQKRSTLYDLTLNEMEKNDTLPENKDSLFLDFRRSARRGMLNLGAGLAQFVGNLSAAAAHLAAKAGDSASAEEYSRTTDEYMKLLEELRTVAQERANPIHQEDESLARTLVLDVAEATPTAIVAMTGFGGMAAVSASGIGSGMAEVRRRTAEGDIALQTAAGLVGFGAQLLASELFARSGGRLFEATMGRFLRRRLAGASGSFTLKALGAGGRFSKEIVRNYADNRTGRGLDLLLQEDAARLEGVASNIDWSEYGKEFVDVELNLREAARTLPYILIGAGRASLHHFRDPRALVADGAALTQWGVPEETQRRLMNETDPRKQNRILYEALHNGTRWGGAGFLEDAARSLRLLHTDDCRPFRDAEVVRDFLQLPAETEAERARVLTLGSASDPDYIRQMVEKHGGGAKIRNPKKAMPFLLMTEVWTQRAFPEGLTGYPSLQELAPPELTRLGDYSEKAEKARSAAVEKTVRYLDALTYRVLLDSTSYNTLTFTSRKPEVVGAEMDALRHKIIAKAAESVLVRAGGAKQDLADQVFGQTLTDYYCKMRFSSAADSWIRFAPPAELQKFHLHALSERARKRGLEMRATPYPELLRAYWAPQGIRNCVMALTNLIPYQADFRTALSRGMTPQEAYAHILHRELGSRLPQADWFPREMAEDITDRSAQNAENREMAEMYTRLTGNAMETREADDGRTYWRILKPDKHYTRWHDSEENCINDLATDSRIRFMHLGGDMGREMAAAVDKNGHYDAARIGEKSRFLYNYYDRLSGVATGDMIRFWQEDATMAVPGAVVEMFRHHTTPAEDTKHPYLGEHPDFPGAWQIDARGARTPLGLMRGRFDAYWRNNLYSGWLSAEDAVDFLHRRGVIDEARRKELLALGKKIVDPSRCQVTTEMFFSGRCPKFRKPYSLANVMRGQVARHLADYTTGYFIAHLRDMPMPDSAREWFGLTPFRFKLPLYDERGSRLQPGTNTPEQPVKWAHRRASERMVKELEMADRVRAQESGENRLQDDPLFPLLLQAFRPSASRSAEQGWAYSLAGGESLMRIRPEAWNLLQEPVRGWSLMDESARRKLYERLEPKTPWTSEDPVPMPRALEQVDAVLREHPELHRYALFPGDASRVVHMDIPEKTNVPGYRRFDSPFDRTEHEGDKIIHGGFRLQEANELPEFFRTDERAMPALRAMSELRRAVHDFPYADGRGVWWKGELYGGKEGKKLVGMDDSWYTVEPMANIRRIFREMPEDGRSVMDFDKGITFGRREALPDDAFLSTTVYRSPSYPLSQVRLMPGERESGFYGTRHPYVTHSFIGAPMHDGYINRNWADLEFHFTPLEDFTGNVTREMIGHMAGWWGKRALGSSLWMLMDRTSSPEKLSLSHNEDISNREVLMQLTEDSRFSASLEGRSPHELNTEEALAATWFHTFAEYETGANPAKAAQDLFRFNEYFTEHPERLEAVEKMLNDHRLWYELDPNDQWYHVITATHEIRELNRRRREREAAEWQERMKRWFRDENEIDRIEFEKSIGKPKRHRRNR